MAYYIRKNGVSKRLAVIPQDYPAELISYDNTTSQLTADDAQEAIDEVKGIADGKVSKSGDTIKGNLNVDRQNGTTSTVGYGLINVGNNIPSGTEKNTQGLIDVFGTTQYRSRIKAGALTGYREVELPDKSGTLALTSDIPAAQVNSDWNASSGVAQILNKPNLATVATSGSYNDLSNKPTIPDISTKVSKSGDTITGTVTLANPNDDSVFILGSSTSTGIFQIQGSGKFINFLAATLTADRNIYLPDKAGTVALTSDISSRKYKENILPLTDEECKKILDVEVVSFDYIEDANIVSEKYRLNNRGVIAEDVENIIPTAIEQISLNIEEKVLGVNYTKFIPYLIKMVQIQQKEIDELKSMIKEMASNETK